MERRLKVHGYRAWRVSRARKSNVVGVSGFGVLGCGV